MTSPLPTKPRPIPRLPTNFNWSGYTLDRSSGIALERYKIGGHSAVWAVANAFNSTMIKGFVIRAPVFLARVDDDQPAQPYVPSNTTPIYSCAIALAYNLLDVIEQRQLSYEGDLDPVINFRAIVQNTAARYQIEPDHAIGYYPAIRHLLDTPSYTAPADIELAIRAKAATDNLDTRT